MEHLTPHKIATIVVPIAQEFGIKELYLFGSMAQGTQTEQSDVDFIYNLPYAPEQYRTVIDFRKRLSESLGRPVDLVRKEYLDEPKKDRDSERIRRAFMHNLQQHPVYKIV
ncbi:MAG: nucleotidyltransferase domain-containing protein [Bifidobacterium pseudolongum]|jgi:predicted nucleotidyltransferase|uniref:Nucleotidyltransferase domain-containing protein n=1 Tax=Bifidobacterium pseudolongum TaxID=1694 RepID=A0A4S4FAR9_9BIFI|nr:nucleotidyltransferase domain-containing protein [Bifidobacterium pseudolongum]MCI8753465.1 nucleotidyltransferase domain-containing protein [Bifidobacterium pseudolongum]THG26958.1 nucleotidyltransferase domain-containing protein [Bifidobacterium pseudolongum]